MAEPIARSGREIAALRTRSGTISELIACAHFMAEGWDVFRSQMWTCPFDLVIHKDGVMKRVEVKTGTVMPGRARSVQFPAPANDLWDVLCVVFDGRAIALDKGPHMHDLRNAVRVWAGYPPLGAPGNPMKLTPDDVRAIRKDPRTNKTAIARDYGVTATMVAAIKSGRARRSVAD